MLEFILKCREAQTEINHVHECFAFQQQMILIKLNTL